MLDFRTMPSVLLCCMILIAVISACSVKEDRTECPCALILDFSGLDTVEVSSVNVLAVSADGVVLNERVMNDAFSEMYVRKVPHGYLQVSVWSGDDSEVDNDRIVHIPYGLECPPVYIDSFVADTRGERCEAQVRLSKNYCKLTVRLSDGNYIPYSFTFKGTVDGYDISGLPSSGEFSCVSYPSYEGESHVLVPRQLDNSLRLQVDDNAPYFKEFALGEYLYRSGYDWYAESLDDVTVILDYSRTSVTIQVAGWDMDQVYNVIL